MFDWYFILASKFLDLLMPAEPVKPVILKPAQVTKPQESVSHPTLPPLCGLYLIKTLEGFRSDAYLDNKGVPTIAFGHTKGVKMGDTCTQQQGFAWIAEDTGWAWDAIRRNVHVPLTQNQGGALLSFVYNLGEPQFLESSTLRLLNKGDYQAAGQAMALYDKETRNGVLCVDAGLVNRRKQEIAMWIGAASPTA